MSAMDVPDYLQGIPQTFLSYKVVTNSGPLIVAIEKTAIQFDPPGTAPNTEAEWEAVAHALAEDLKSKLPELARHDRIRISDGVSWHHLDLTADLLSQQGIKLQTNVHWVQRQK